MSTITLGSQTFTLPCVRFTHFRQTTLTVELKDNAALIEVMRNLHSARLLEQPVLSFESADGAVVCLPLHDVGVVMGMPRPEPASTPRPEPEPSTTRGLGRE